MGAGMVDDMDRGVERVFTGNVAVTTGACPWASIGTRIRVGERAKRLLSASVTKTQHIQMHWRSIVTL